MDNLYDSCFTPKELPPITGHIPQVGPCATEARLNPPQADDASYSKAVMDDSPLPAMTVDELIQTMRLKSLSEVRAGLEKARAKRVHQFNLICEFYRGLK